MSTSSVHNFGTEIDMDLRFFALVHKYSLVLDSIRIEKVIFFRFLGGGSPLKFLLTSAKKWPKTGEKLIFMKNGKKIIIRIRYEETDPTIKNCISIIV